MKILYNDIKEFLPGLKASPKEVGEFLTLAGFMMDGFEKVKHRGKTDYLISLEVRHNRADCLSVLGFVNEIAAKWNIKAKKPPIAKLPKKQASDKIKVADGKYVRRVLAYEISGLKNRKSPPGLVEWLGFYGMNSKNLLVDISNYVMLLTGHPSHLLDTAKINGQLRWDLNKDFQSITTLDGTLVQLTGDREIILRDDKNILALAGIVGGKKAELDMNTDSIIAEMAIYDPGTVRKNSVGTKVITEASTRLSRWLDPNGLDYAMDLLLSQIIGHCGGKNTAIKEFSYYPRRFIPPKIKFNPEKPALYAGIDIPKDESIEILKRLRFRVKGSGKNYVVAPPTDRMDVAIEEDLIEEVTRIYGFDKIPSDQIPKLEVTKDITPMEIKVAEKMRDSLSTMGYDEIISSPLTTKELNQLTNHEDWALITTQNAVNEEFPDLRQSIATGLLNQLAEYRKKNLAFIQIFEIGKVFGQVGKKYLEHESLGILYNHTAKGPALAYLRYIKEMPLRYIGLDEISYRGSRRIPQIANPYCCFDILVKDQPVGIIYKLTPQVKNESVYFSEVNLSAVSKLASALKEKPSVELTKKLITLDANLELDKKESIYAALEKFKQKIGKKHLWSIAVSDAFPVGNKVKYTIRVSYQELSDPEAKKLHLKTFRLK